ncbi:MAG: acetyl-CoA carboxylase biotin carboxyl carrier protein [Pseudonocardiaceae bacterium]
MSDPNPPTSAQELKTLCQEVIALVRSLPGPLGRIAVRTTEHTVEVEWPIGDATPAPMITTQPSTPVARTLAPVPDEAVHVVRAPLVGTFYRLPQPDADPFVSIGDIVEAGQTVAIVEAMKLLNHIVAEVAGRIVEICVGDGEPVEFDQPLMRILPLVDDQAA